VCGNWSGGDFERFHQRAVAGRSYRCTGRPRGRASRSWFGRAAVRKHDDVIPGFSSVAALPRFGPPPGMLKVQDQDARAEVPDPLEARFTIECLRR
jgi:hypothetical protein